MSLCLAAGAGKAVSLALASFTLAWTHTIEKIDWEEDWRVTPAGLELVEARVKGTGAGMEPPAEAKFDGTWWRWHPGGPVRMVVVLRRAAGVPDWRLCTSQGCRGLGEFVAGDPVALAPCDAE